MQSEHVFKIIIIGQASTGKTSFIKRYVHELFSNQYKATIGVDFALKTLQYDENTLVRLQLWDIAGQERFQTLSRAYYKDAVGSILAYDVSKPNLEQVLSYKTSLDAQVSLSDGSPIPCLLLANKCDLLSNNDDVSTGKSSPSLSATGSKFDQEKESMKEFVKQNGFIDCIFASPKLNINVDLAARVLVKEILRRQENLNYFQEIDHIEADLNRTGSIKINENNSRCKQQISSSWSCCRS